MTEETPQKRKKTRNRQMEYARRRTAREEEAAKRELQQAPPSADEIKLQLALLAKRTAEAPTDADRDIDFAYRNSGNPAITPLMAPSVGAWQWYEYARDNHAKFLEICAKREDAKAKAAGSISAQRMEDDRRQQFAIIDRIMKHLQLDVKAVANDLMEKCPEDLLNECRRHKDAWKAYFERFPL